MPFPGNNPIAGSNPIGGLGGSVGSGVFDPIGGIGGGGGGIGSFSTSSTEFVGAAITITSPSGQSVSSNFRVDGTAWIKMHTSSFMKVDSHGYPSSRDWFITDGFSVTVDIGGEEHEAHVSSRGNEAYWYYDVDEAEYGEVTITAQLDDTVTESSRTYYGHTPGPGYSRYKHVNRTDSVDVTVKEEGITVTASLQEVMIGGDPCEATIEGTIESELDAAVESVQWKLNNEMEGSLKNLFDDWSNWRAVIELPNRDEKHEITITAHNVEGYQDDASVTIPKGEPFVTITKPSIPDVTIEWEGTTIPVTVRGEVDADYSTIETVKWEVTHPVFAGEEGKQLASVDFETKEGEATEEESSSNWSEWFFEFDIEVPYTHILKVQAVDTDGNTDKMDDDLQKRTYIVGGTEVAGEGSFPWYPPWSYPSPSPWPLPGETLPWLR